MSRCFAGIHSEEGLAAGLSGCGPYHTDGNICGVPPLLHEIDQTVLGALLGISSGALVYVGATHLLPLAEREEKLYSLAAMAGGAFVALGIILTHV